MRTECVDPRYGLNPDEMYWIYSTQDVQSLLRLLEKGQKNEAQRILQERRFPLGWQSNKKCQSGNILDGLLGQLLEWEFFIGSGRSVGLVRV